MSPAGNRRARILLLATTLACAGCDQAAKHAAVGALGGGGAVEFAGGVLRMEVVENTGGFLSLGARLPAVARWWILTMGVGVGLAAAGVLVLRSARMAAGAGAVRTTSFGWALFLGGGLGNWIDRVGMGGHVVDFLQLRIGGLRTGIFNLADFAILAGASLVLLEHLGRSRGAAAERCTAPPGPMR